MNDNDKMTHFTGMADQTEGPLVTIFDGNSAPRTVRLNEFGKNCIYFGRAPKNDIVLTSHLVSFEHGRFVCKDESWVMEDKAAYKGSGSTNGLIYNDEEAAELPVAEDSYVRIDDGVETVVDGVLVVFPSENYSEDWNPIRMAGNKILLNVIEPLIGSYIEHLGGSFYLNLSGSAPDVSINHRKAQKRTLLHEKDFIETVGYRIVFTSAALYYNRLQGGMFSGHPGQAQPVEVGNQQYDRAKPFVSASSRNGKDAQFAPSVHAEHAHESRCADQAAQGSGGQPSSRPKKGSSADRSSGKDIRSFLASAGGYYLMVLVFALIIWGIAVFLWTSQSEIAIVVMLACAYFGWNALNSIQPAMFIWMPWMSWIIYVVVKFILSAIIGLFVAPFRIGKWIAGIVNSSVQ